MVFFGNPPDKNVTSLSYPGVSGSRFNPLEANRIWGECVKKEKEGRYVHSLLEAHHKLGLDEKWGKDASRRNGLLPDYESLQEVYSRLGWKVTSLGKVVPPDPHKRIANKRKSSHPSSKHRRKLQHSTSAGIFFHSPVPEVKTDPNLVHNEASKPQRTQDEMVARGKMSRTKLREKVAAAVHSALEHECLAMLSSLDDAAAKSLRAPPSEHVHGAQYIPRTQNSMRKHSSVPIFATARRALGRARGCR